jgi:hypothetical protein
MFHKRQVIDFLWDIIQDETLEILPFVKYEKMDGRVPCANKISQTKDDTNVRVCQLSLNRKYFGVKKDSNFLKAIILHEIGHAIICNNSKVDNEFYAHIWAMSKANKMGLPGVVKQLIVMILEWGEIEWSDLRGRRYRMANKKFKELVKIK